MWQLRVTGKVKHFGWKVLRGFPPSYGVLAGRHIPLIPQRPICKRGMEDTQHCIFTCLSAMEVWTQLSLNEVIQKVVAEDGPGSVTMHVLMRQNVQDGDFP